MSFSWSAYLDMAEVFLVLQPAPHWPESYEEAIHRIAISRAYYAAFCTARNVARDHEGLTLTGSGRDHGLVIRHYQGRSRSHRRIAVALRRLRDVRGQVDYDDAIDEDLALLVQNAVQDAHNVLDMLQGLHPG